MVATALLVVELEHDEPGRSLYRGNSWTVVRRSTAWGHFLRDNIMSYWDSAEKTLTPEQVALVRKTLGQRSVRVIREPTAVIVQVDHDPLGDDVAGERVIVANPTPNALDLIGWRLSDAKRHTYIFKTLILGRAKSVSVWTKKGGKDSVEDVFWGRSAAVWNNRGGDVATLRNRDGHVVSRCVVLGEGLS